MEKIKRYHIAGGVTLQHENGFWVKYSDHLKAVRRKSVSREQIEQIMSDIHMRWLRRDKDMLEGTIDGIDSGDTRKRLSVVMAEAILKLLGEKP